MLISVALKDWIDTELFALITGHVRQLSLFRSFIEGRHEFVALNLQGAAEPADRRIVAQLLRPVMQALDAGLEAYQAELRIAAR